MSNTPEPDGMEVSSAQEELREGEKLYTPRWSGCVGLFNDGIDLDSRKNEEVHYRKHVIIGREWDEGMSLEEYRSRATEHLDDLDDETVLEFCQADDLAVVKYNLDTGELGIARRDDGSIKTFFRPNDIYYILRKVDAGAWGEPDIIDGYESGIDSSDFAGDPQKNYLFDRLEALALELPPQAHSLVATIAAGEELNEGDLVLLLARFGECRFIVYELHRRILTEEQSDLAFSLRKKIVGAVASFEALERYRNEELTGWTRVSLEGQIVKQEVLWNQAADLITNYDEFDNSLIERELIGYALLELKVLQLHRRMLTLDIPTYEQRLRRNDIHLRSVFYRLAQQFGYRSMNPVWPETFFWRQMATNLD